MFSGSVVFFVLGWILVGLGILSYLLWKLQGCFLMVVLSMIVVGVIGNFIDGLQCGQVIDMIYLLLLSVVIEVINGICFFIFNIVDMCVVGGIILLFVVSLLLECKCEKVVFEV